MATGNVLSLPRGGFVVDTSIGKIQVGAPPETIKVRAATPLSDGLIAILTPCACCCCCCCIDWSISF